MTQKEKALSIIRILQDNDYKAVLAGGCVRDMLLNIKPHDYDIATSAIPEQIIALFPKTIAIGQAFGVIGVLMDTDLFEVATFRTDKKYLDGRHPLGINFSTIRKDAHRRDFTINAIFYDPLRGECIDYFDGQSDLKNHILRFVGSAKRRIEEDKLRILRAVRFAVQFDLKIDKNAFEAILKNAPKINDISSERIRDEITKLFRLGKPRNSLELLKNTRLLDQILPEVSALIGAEQNPDWHAEGDVFQHTIIALEKLFENNKVLSDELIWATLLHDIGKPTTALIENDKVRNRGHESVGAEIARNIMVGLKFSNKFMDKVCWLVQEHMRIKRAEEMRLSKLKKLIAQEYIEDLIALASADTLASTGNLKWRDVIRQKQNKLKPERIKPPPLITGYDLINLGLVPGPIFKELLNEIEILQLEEEIDTKEKALEYIQKRIR